MSPDEDSLTWCISPCSPSYLWVPVARHPCETNRSPFSPTDASLGLNAPCTHSPRIIYVVSRYLTRARTVMTFRNIGVKHSSFVTSSSAVSLAPHRPYNYVVRIMKRENLWPIVLLINLNVDLSIRICVYVHPVAYILFWIVHRYKHSRNEIGSFFFFSFLLFVKSFFD